MALVAVADQSSDQRTFSLEDIDQSEPDLIENFSLESNELPIFREHLKRKRLTRIRKTLLTAIDDCKLHLLSSGDSNRCWRLLLLDYSVVVEYFKNLHPKGKRERVINKSDFNTAVYNQEGFILFKKFGYGNKQYRVFYRDQPGCTWRTGSSSTSLLSLSPSTSDSGFSTTSTATGLITAKDSAVRQNNQSTVAGHTTMLPVEETTNESERTLNRDRNRSESSSSLEAIALEDLVVQQLEGSTNSTISLDQLSENAEDFERNSDRNLERSRSSNSVAEGDALSPSFDEELILSREVHSGDALSPSFDEELILSREVHSDTLFHDSAVQQQESIAAIASQLENEALQFLENKRDLERSSNRNSQRSESNNHLTEGCLDVSHKEVLECTLLPQSVSVDKVNSVLVKSCHFIPGYDKYMVFVFDGISTAFCIWDWFENDLCVQLPDFKRPTRVTMLVTDICIQKGFAVETRLAARGYFSVESKSGRSPAENTECYEVGTNSLENGGIEVEYQATVELDSEFDGFQKCGIFILTDRSVRFEPDTDIVDFDPRVVTVQIKCPKSERVGIFPIVLNSTAVDDKTVIVQHKWFKVFRQEIVSVSYDIATSSNRLPAASLSVSERDDDNTDDIKLLTVPYYQEVTSCDLQKCRYNVLSGESLSQKNSYVVVISSDHQLFVVSSCWIEQRKVFFKTPDHIALLHAGKGKISVFKDLTQSVSEPTFLLLAELTFKVENQPTDSIVFTPTNPKSGSCAVPHWISLELQRDLSREIEYVALLFTAERIAWVPASYVPKFKVLALKAEWPKQEKVLIVLVEMKSACSASAIPIVTRGLRYEPNLPNQWIHEFVCQGEICSPNCLDRTTGECERLQYVSITASDCSNDMNYTVLIHDKYRLSLVEWDWISKPIALLQLPAWNYPTEAHIAIFDSFSDDFLTVCAEDTFHYAGDPNGVALDTVKRKWREKYLTEPESTVVNTEIPCDLKLDDEAEVDFFEDSSYGITLFTENEVAIFKAKLFMWSKFPRKRFSPPFFKFRPNWSCPDEVTVKVIPVLLTTSGTKITVSKVIPTYIGKHRFVTPNASPSISQSIEEDSDSGSGKRKRKRPRDEKSDKSENKRMCVEQNQSSAAKGTEEPKVNARKRTCTQTSFSTVGISASPSQMNQFEQSKPENGESSDLGLEAKCSQDDDYQTEQTLASQSETGQFELSEVEDPNNSNVLLEAKIARTGIIPSLDHNHETALTPELMKQIFRKFSEFQHTSNKSEKLSKRYVTPSTVIKHCSTIVQEINPDIVYNDCVPKPIENPDNSFYKHKTTEDHDVILEYRLPSTYDRKEVQQCTNEYLNLKQKLVRSNAITDVTKAISAALENLIMISATNVPETSKPSEPDDSVLIIKALKRNGTEEVLDKDMGTDYVAILEDFRMKRLEHVGNLASAVQQKESAKQFQGEMLNGVEKATNWEDAEQYTNSSRDKKKKYF